VRWHPSSNSLPTMELLGPHPLEYTLKKAGAAFSTRPSRQIACSFGDLAMLRYAAAGASELIGEPMAKKASHNFLEMADHFHLILVVLTKLRMVFSNTLVASFAE